MLAPLSRGPNQDRRFIQRLAYCNDNTRQRDTTRGDMEATKHARSRCPTYVLLYRANSLLLCPRRSQTRTLVSANNDVQSPVHIFPCDPKTPPACLYIHTTADPPPSEAVREVPPRTKTPPLSTQVCCSPSGLNKPQKRGLFSFSPTARDEERNNSTRQLYGFPASRGPLQQRL